MIAVVLALMHHHARYVAQHIADAHHHLVADQLVRHHRDRLRQVDQRRRRLRRGGDAGDPIAGRRVHRHVLPHAGDLQHELQRRRSGSAGYDRLAGLAKAVGGNPDDEPSRWQRQRERAHGTGRAGDRGRRARGIVGCCGHARSDDWRPQLVEHDAPHNHGRRLLAGRGVRLTQDEQAVENDNARTKDTHFVENSRRSRQMNRDRRFGPQHGGNHPSASGRAARCVTR